MRDDQRGSVRWLTLASWLSLVMFAVSSTLISVSLRHIGLDLQINFARRGALASLRTCALVVSALASGLLAERLGKRWLLGCGMFATALGLFWIGGVSTYGGLVAGLLLLGSGLGVLEALVSPLAAELHPQGVALHLNVLHAFYPVGILLSSLPVGRALDRGLPWQAPFAIAALPAAAVGVMFLTGRYPAPAGPRRTASQAAGDVLRNPLFYLLAAAMLFGAGCEGGLFYWIANFVDAEYGMGALAGAAAVALFSLAMVAGRFGLGALAHGTRMRPLMLTLAALGAAFSLLLAVLDSPAAGFVLIGAAGICVSFFWPGVLSLAAQMMGTSSSTMFALLASAGIAGFGLAPHLIGLVAQAHGLRAGLMVLPGVFVLTGVMVEAVFRLHAAQVRTDELTH